MKPVIRHKGKVLFVEGNRIDVEMEFEDGCSSCGIQKSCGMDDATDKVISLHTESAGWYEAGDSVIVSIGERKGVRAAVYYYMVPFFIIIAILLVMNELGMSELATALTALSSFLLYNIVLYFFRHRIEREIVYKIERGE